MKKQTEKLPIDDLFSRKLEKMSLEPSADAWEILQAKIGNSPVRRITPSWYWYAAAAACVVLVATIGRVSWSTFVADDKSGQEVAITSRVYQLKTKLAAPAVKESNTSAGAHQQMPLIVLDAQRPTLVQASKQPQQQHNKEETVALQDRIEIKNTEDKLPLERAEDLAGNMVESVIPKTDVKAIAPINSQAANKHTEERTLVVSIAAPSTVLVNDQPRNARQETLISAFNDNKTDEEQKPTKAVRFLRKLKQLKEGEEVLVANVKQEDNEDESGLLGRLYGNVRHSIDSKKAGKK